IHHALACSGDGSVAVGYTIQSETDPPNPQQAMVWDSAGQATLLPDDPLNLNSRAWGVSSNGVLMVGDWHNRAVVWPSRSDRLERAPVSGIAKAISADGSTVVGGVATGAFRWTIPDGLLVFDASADPFALTRHGDVIVGAWGPGGQAFQWTAQGGLATL